MKKGIFLLTLMFILGCSTVGFASNTFDANGDSTNSTITGVLQNFKCSKNVEILVNSVTQSYAAIASHYNGDRAFGSASGDPKIHWESKTTGTYATAPTASDSSAVTGSGWSDL